jgi:hypothetical protein
MQGAKKKTSDKKRDNPKMLGAKKKTSDKKRGNLKNASGHEKDLR